VAHGETGRHAAQTRSRPRLMDFLGPADHRLVVGPEPRHCPWGARFCRGGMFFVLKCSAPGSPKTSG
jgi:hypothetical protein